MAKIPAESGIETHRCDPTRVPIEELVREMAMLEELNPTKIDWGREREMQKRAQESCDAIDALYLPRVKVVTLKLSRD